MSLVLRHLASSLGLLRDGVAAVGRGRRLVSRRRRDVLGRPVGRKSRRAGRPDFGGGSPLPRIGVGLLGIDDRALLLGLTLGLFGVLDHARLGLSLSERVLE